jgi:hypothetical protein
MIFFYLIIYRDGRHEHQNGGHYREDLGGFTGRSKIKK